MLVQRAGRVGVSANSENEGPCNGLSGPGKSLSSLNPQKQIRELPGNTRGNERAKKGEISTKSMRETRRWDASSCSTKKGHTAKHSKTGGSPLVPVPELVSALILRRTLSRHESGAMLGCLAWGPGDFGLAPAAGLVHILAAGQCNAVSEVSGLVSYFGHLASLVRLVVTNGLLLLRGSYSGY